MTGTEDASARERKFSPLREIGGVRERLTNVLIFEIREVVEQIFNGSACRESLDDHADSDAHAPYTRLSTHDFGIGGNASELLHVVRIASNSTAQVGAVLFSMPHEDRFQLKQHLLVPAECVASRAAGPPRTLPRSARLVPPQYPFIQTELWGLPLLLIVTEARANAAFACCEKTLIQFGFRLCTQCALSARGLSESNREDLGKRCPSMS